jgi:ribosomal protein L7/L12
MVSESRRSRRERDALATRLALSRGDIPAPVIDLLLAGQKIQAIKCYREETGVSLKEAKGLIDSL